MKIKLFENFNEIDVMYGVSDLDKNGDKIGLDLSEDESDEYDPFSLVDSVVIFMKYEKTHPNLFIEKMTTEIVDKEIINEIKLKLLSNKYNI
jgi:hypothetical protein